MAKGILKQLFCKHPDKVFVCNVHGDNINRFSTIKRITRSMWVCKDCGKPLRSEHLITKQSDESDALLCKFY